MASILRQELTSMSSTSISQSSFHKRCGTQCSMHVFDLKDEAYILQPMAYDAVQINTSRGLAERGGPEQLQWMTQVLLTVIGSTKFMWAVPFSCCSPSLKTLCSTNPPGSSSVSVITCRHLQTYNCHAVLAGVSVSGLSHRHGLALSQST